MEPSSIGQSRSRLRRDWWAFYHSKTLVLLWGAVLIGLVVALRLWGSQELYGVWFPLVMWVIAVLFWGPKLAGRLRILHRRLWRR